MSVSRTIFAGSNLDQSKRQKELENTKLKKVVENPRAIHYLFAFTPGVFIMDFSRFVDVLIDAGMVQGIFLALVLLTNKNGKRRSNRILSVLLLVLSISIAHSVFMPSIANTPYRIKEPFILLIGPLLLFYFREAAGLERLNRSDVLHLIPFILFFVVLWPVYIFGPSTAYSQFLILHSVTLTAAMWTLAVLQYGFYLWVVVRLYRKHVSSLESEFSNTEGKTLSWMKSFFHIFGWTFVLLVITIPVAVHSGDYVLVSTIVNCTLSLAVFILGYEGLFQEEVFSTGTALQPVDAVPGTTSQEPQQPPEVAREVVQNLLSFVAEKKPYLDEALTLTQLATQLGMSRNQLSLVINNGVGQSFYTFINTYRVEEAKRLIADPKNANFTFLSLAFEAGFPSKSSFHNIFKKVTGLTPTEYRNTLPRP